MPNRFDGKRSSWTGSTRYNYGKIFKKKGKWYRYRYTNGRKSTKKLVRYIRKRDR